MSDFADRYYDLTGTRMNFAMTLSGSWSQDSFSYFKPGKYTLVCGDEWGDIIVVHFLVRSA